MRLKVSNVCQVFNKEEFIATTTRDGITFTNNGDGSFTINGTATANIFIALFKSGTEVTGFNINHKYLICGNLSNTIQIFETLSVNGTRHYKDSIFTCVRSEGYLDLRITVGITATNYVFRPQLFDLTEMYGAGNEPTTVEQFRQDFPNEMYGYSPECWKKFRRLKYVTETKNLFDINKLTAYTPETLPKGTAGYQPYGYLPLNRGKYIANKEPVQLLDKSKYPATITNNGVTFTNNGDGTITANGTSTGNYAYYSIMIPRPAIGHKILVLPKRNDNTQDHIYVWGSSSGSYSSWVDDLGYGGNIITITGIGNTLKKPYTWIGINLNVNKGWVMNNHIYKLQLFDLTEMYGAGHEPATVEQFRADFPNELYDYNPYNAITFR